MPKWMEKLHLYAFLHFDEKSEKGCDIFALLMLTVRSVVDEWDLFV